MDSVIPIGALALFLLIIQTFLLAAILFAIIYILLIIAHIFMAFAEAFDFFDENVFQRVDVIFNNNNNVRQRLRSIRRFFGM